MHQSNFSKIRIENDVLHTADADKARDQKRWEPILLQCVDISLAIPWM